MRFHSRILLAWEVSAFPLLSSLMFSADILTFVSCNGLAVTEETCEFVRMFCGFFRYFSVDFRYIIILHFYVYRTQPCVVYASMSYFLSLYLPFMICKEMLAH